MQVGTQINATCRPPAARIFHRRNAVGIVGHERDEIDGPVCGVVRHVQADSHVHALLLEIWLEVRVLQAGGISRDRYPLGNPAAKFQHAASDRAEVTSSERMQPSIGTRELMLASRDGQRHRCCVRRTVVVENTLDVLAAQGACAAEMLDEYLVEYFMGSLRQDADVPAINQDRNPSHTP